MHHFWRVIQQTVEKNAFKEEVEKGLWAVTKEDSVVYMDMHNGFFRASILEFEDRNAVSLIIIVSPISQVIVQRDEVLDITIPKGKDVGEEIISTLSIKEGTEKWDIFNKLMHKCPKEMEHIKLTLPHEM